MAPLVDLPPEVIHQIFICVPPAFVPTLQQVCQKFNHLATPLLWRHHCQTLFKFWDPSHHFHAKCAAEVASADWKELFAERYSADCAINRHIASLLASQTGRIAKAEQIIGYGYDAKDTLLKNMHVDDGADDVLARRYYSAAVLAFLHRKMALQELIKLSLGKYVSLERALGSLDLFVLRDRFGDLEDISSDLDRIANDFSKNASQFTDKSTRNRATKLAEYLKAERLTGIDVDVDSHYHDLQNNFIGIALRDANHPSLPLISVTIYCCVAQRLGIDAQPCGFPFHVLAIIKPFPGQMLTGQAINETTQDEVIYIDPFRSNEEVFPRDLKSQLDSLRVPPDEQDSLLGPSSTADIVRRSAKNIITSVQTLGPATNDLSASVSVPDIDSAFYAALWVLTLLPEGSPRTVIRQRARMLPHLKAKLDSQFSMDIAFLETYLSALFNAEDEAYQISRDSIRDLRAEDTRPRTVKKRGPMAMKAVQYRVGQVFHHRRYYYKAVITGWDTECAASDEWMANMSVDDLDNGRHQSFYHVMVEDKTSRYVAEENINIIQEAPGERLMELAGQHFKRWDSKTHTFISNIKDEYPDD